MARIQYGLDHFDSSKAMQGALCVGVGRYYSNTTIYNISIDENNVESKNYSFLGAGICKYIVPNRFLFSVDGVTYEFDNKGLGKPNTPSAQYKLMLAEVPGAVVTSGSVITSSSTTTVSRGGSGEVTGVSTNYSKQTKYIIDNLNARDEFAVNALREMMRNVPDPSVLSNNEMNFYCNMAYQWAANMMKAAANARSVYTTTKNTTEGEEEEEEVNNDITSEATVSTSDLTSNTEKILNNLIVALQRTTSAKTANNKVTYYQNVNVQFDELITLIKNYIKKDEETNVGLKDLIDAIKENNGNSPNNATLKSLIDERIQLWLNSTTVSIDGLTYGLQVPTSAPE